MPALTQSPGSLDTNFVTVAGTDVYPNVIVPTAEGSVYVAGSFTNYGSSGRAGIARLTATGAIDATFQVPRPLLITAPVIINHQVILPGSTNAGTVAAVLVLDDGRPVIAGSFTHLGSTPVPGLAILKTDGSLAVTAFAVDKVEPANLLRGPGGTFYVGGKGFFESTRLPYLRFRADGTRDAGFSPPTLASLGYASSSTTMPMRGPGDTLYLVTAAASTSFALTFDLLRLTPTGTLDASFADSGRAAISNPNFGTFVSTTDGQVIFTGLTSYRGAALARKINRLTLAGALDDSFVSTVDPGFGGRVVAVQADGKVLHTSTTQPIRRLNANGSVDTGYANPAQVPVRQIALSLLMFGLAPDQSLYAGGFQLNASFQQVFGAFHILGDPASGPVIATPPASQIVTSGARTRFQVIAQGAAPFTYQWRRNDTPISGATQSELILDPTGPDLAGSYTVEVRNALGTTVSTAATLTVLEPTPGSIFRESDVPDGPNAVVQDLAFDNQGRLIIAGGFTKVHGQNRTRVARLLHDGRTVDPDFDTSGLSSQVNLPENLLVLSSGKVLITGNYSISYGGHTHQGTIRLDATGRLDETFNPSGVGGDIQDRFAETADGRLLVNSRTWNGVALASSYGRLEADGALDATFQVTPAFLPSGALLALPDGSAILGGQTNLSLGTAGVLKVQPNGTVDPTFYRGPLRNLSNPRVLHLLRQPDGKILVAGAFTYSEGMSTIGLGVLRLLPDGQLDPEFNPAPSLSALHATGIAVRRMALQADGRILILGDFTAVGGFSRPGIARLWSNGTVDPEFLAPTPKLSSGLASISDLVVTSDNTVFVGGRFDFADDAPRTNLVRLNGGALRPPPTPPIIASVPSRVVAVAGTNLVLEVNATGAGPLQYQWYRNLQTGSTNFQHLAGETNAMLNLAGVRVEDSGLYYVTVINPGGAATCHPFAMLVQENPALPGHRDRSYTGAGSLAGVTAPGPDGSIYAALAQGVARSLEDGTRDTNFLSPSDLLTPDSSTDNSISTLLRQPDGKLLVAGRLSMRTGPCNLPNSGCFDPQRGLVRLLPDGSYDPAFFQENRHAGNAQQKPLALGLQSDGSILVAGSFENFAGQNIPALVRLTAAGQFDPTFASSPGIQTVLQNPTRTVPGSISTLHVLPDDRIVIGGAFNRVHGVVRFGVARLLPDGALDTSFVPPTDSNVATGNGGPMTYHALGPVTSSGQYYIFGRFQPVNNGPIHAALRLNADGSIDPSFQVQTDFAINTGAVQSDGRLIISGQFTIVNGQPRNLMARLNVDGSLDTSFDFPAPGPGVGMPLTLLADGKLLAADLRYFTGVGAEVAAPRLSFTFRAGVLELSWPSGHRLQRATQLLPPDWSDLAVTSPFTVPTRNPGEFFRIVQTP
ncbi:MAG: immunoglobulin domain-containing protein [Verrucomicrobiales bacterium]|nr:immunoglobulin domain-containing protein [Verrucomicrobiales bacterium]